MGTSPWLLFGGSCRFCLVSWVWCCEKWVKIQDSKQLGVGCASSRHSTVVSLGFICTPTQGKQVAADGPTLLVRLCSKQLSPYLHLALFWGQALPGDRCLVPALPSSGLLRDTHGHCKHSTANWAPKFWRLSGRDSLICVARTQGHKEDRVEMAE
jgi:hypothetical protein